MKLLTLIALIAMVQLLEPSCTACENSNVTVMMPIDAVRADTINAGSLITTPESGAIEYDTTIRGRGIRHSKHPTTDYQTKWPN